ncbi:tumor necrosis factor receptor superfamily member 4 [Gadus chalcogrammus]|uniref:tumor necrosis factor receptor superfamily member 4 n=1 Tax=Gadus chalcogrammus TaxID=1042646 RepID=UPI0024C4B6AD|nr:tumor necrosis factor receptor superfamily member 4 [Gadus chalcogrammus]XP_056462139.1 tumor necrosis factor receptor superfamily member 4 [Gadus chalcogrammus]XP_056462140.1 tumor necrosis factor receptor superfamily member 4 [Gadus chalcogrammus]
MMGFHLCCSSSPAAQGTGAFGCTPGLSTNAKMPTLVLQTSRLPLILIWTMYFNGLVIALDASFHCIKGQRVANRAKKICEQCSEGYYQPEASDSQFCVACTKCDEKRGSKEESPCSPTVNRVCRCLKGFSPSEDDSATCKCEKGSGKPMDGHEECRECGEGYFSTRIDSVCSPWTKCTDNKVRINGSKTSDVVCHDHLPPITMTPGLKTETTSLRTLHTSPPPEISTPTALPHQKAPANNTPAAVHNRKNHVIGGLVVGVVVGLLILTAVVIRCRAKEDPACKSPIKETQQEKNHLMDTV